MAKFIKTITTRAAEGATLFWLFNQNNAGGYWREELPVYLIIEARTYRSANAVAEELGVDFRDVNDFSGARWSAADAWTEAMVTPAIDGQELESFLETTRYIPYHPFVAAVVRLDGTVTEYRKP